MKGIPESREETLGKMDEDMDCLYEDLYGKCWSFARSASMEEIKDAYHHAISLAAGLEKLMIWRGKDES